MTDPSTTTTLQTTLADRSFQRILMVKPSSLGDIIHALPVLHGLRSRFPDARISWLIAEPFAPMIRRHPQLDDIIIFDRRRFARLYANPGAALEFARFLRSLRCSGFDLAIDLQGLFRSGLLTYATGASVRIGFHNAREGASIFYTHRLRTENDDLHAADKNYLVSRLLGFDHLPMQFDLAVTDEERSAAAKLVTGAGLDPEQPFIAVLPGARWETKRWPPERFATAIDRIFDRCSLPALLLGDSSEAPLCRQVAARAQSGPLNLAGATGIRDAVAILERAALVITHDSAPMHIATALHRPLVAILGPTNPRRTGPYKMSSAVLQADLPCAPCYLKHLAQCPYDHRCMQTVEVDDVVSAAVDAFQQAGGTAGATPIDAGLLHE